MRLRWGFLLVPVLLVFGVFYLVPTATFVLSGFRPELGLGRVGDTFTLENFRLLLTDWFFLWVLANTAKLSLYITGISLLLGFPMGYILARSGPRAANLLVPILLLSSFITLVIRALGWVILLGNNGPVNRTLLFLGVAGEPVQFLNHPRGVVLGMVHYVLPLMVLSLMSVVKTIPVSLEQAAENLGAGRLRVYTRVVLPLSLPGILSASLVIFSLSMGVFATPLLLGGGKVYVLPILIYQEITAKTRYAMGAAMALVLVALVLLINALSTALAARFQAPRRAAP